MSAEDIADNWFGGPAKKSENPRELLKLLPPVSRRGREDYGNSLELGAARGTQLELKYLSWGLFPSHELVELITMVRIRSIKQAIVFYEQRNQKADIATALNIPPAEKEKAKKLSQGMADFFKGPMA